MLELLHRRVHHASHFQVCVLDGAGVVEPILDHLNGGVLASFGNRGIVVSTAWDENGAVPPHVEIVITAGGHSGAAFDDLKPIAEGEFHVGDQGVDVGNVIAADLARVPVAPGRYLATVFADVVAPFVARRVRIHLMALV
jgi:hypothetical protein